jgi:thiamine pyrophosphate-dependent acetolactate synthase large subunit-like protein
VTEPAQLQAALKEALNDPKPNIVNVMIDPKSQRKPQQFEWLTR